MQSIILCLNMATFSGGFSLLSADGMVITEQGENEGYPWATFLVARIKDSLDQSGYNFSALNKIIFTQGPGSFTGIRIGIAVARTLSQFLNISAVGVTTLQAWAAFSQVVAQQRKYPYIQVVIDSKRADLYIQKFCSQTLHPLNEIKTIYPQALNVEKTDFFAGDGVGFLSLPLKQTFPAFSFSSSILNNFKENVLEENRSLTPLYLNTPV